MKQRQLIVDPEFESLIMAPSEDEFKQLRENILDDGEVREPLVTWNGIILDGHNRWKIIQENPDIPYKTMEMIFFSRNEAKVWMIRNQLGRRNLTDYDRSKLALKLKPLLAEEAKKRMTAGKADPEQKSAEGRAPQVREELAKIAGVSHDTIHKVDVIEQKAAPEVKEQLSKGEISINRAYQDIRKAEQNEEPPKQEYTIDTLVSEISAGSENYIRFIRQTLVNRSTLYSNAEDRKRVYEAVSNVKKKLEELENLLK